MKNLLALIGLLLVVFLGVGWYRGWYKFDVQKTAGGTTKYSFDVDRGKIGDDLDSAKDRSVDFIDSLKQKAGEPTQPTSLPPEPAPPQMTRTGPPAGLQGPIR